MAREPAVGQWDHSILHAERAAKAGDSFCKVCVAGLGPTVLQIEALPDESVRVLRPRIAAHLGLCADLEMVIVCGAEILSDDCLVGELPDLRIQCVWIQTPHFEQMQPRFEGARYFRGGGTRAHNGKVYMPPWWTGKVLEIDLESRTIQQLGDEIPGEDLYVSGGVVAGDAIYFAPANALRVLCIIPEIGAVQQLEPDMEGARKYTARGVLETSGRIYFPPSFAEKVLCIDPDQRLVTLIGPSLLGYNKYFAGAVASQGLVFFAPHWARKVLCIEPWTDTVEELEPALEGVDQYKFDGIVTQGGDVFFAPDKVGKVLRINPSNRSVFALGPEVEGYHHILQLAGGVLAPNGRVYFAPYHDGSYNAGKVLTILGENVIPSRRPA